MQDGTVRADLAQARVQHGVRALARRDASQRRRGAASPEPDDVPAPEPTRDRRVERLKVAVVELRVNRDAGKRVIAAMTRDVLRLGLYGWRDRTRDEKAFRVAAVKAERFLMAFTRRTRFRAFNRWREALASCAPTASRLLGASRR